MVLSVLQDVFGTSKDQVCVPQCDLSPVGEGVPCILEDPNFALEGSRTDPERPQ